MKHRNPPAAFCRAQLDTPPGRVAVKHLTQQLCADLERIVLRDLPSGPPCGPPPRLSFPVLPMDVQITESAITFTSLTPPVERGTSP